MNPLELAQYEVAGNSLLVWAVGGAVGSFCGTTPGRATTNLTSAAPP